MDEFFIFSLLFFHIFLFLFLEFWIGVEKPFLNYSLLKPRYFLPDKLDLEIARIFIICYFFVFLPYQISHHFY